MVIPDDEFAAGCHAHAVSRLPTLRAAARVGMPRTAR